MGSWITYGLGTENQNLPGFVVMCPGGYPIKETENWQSAFLPGVLPGTYIDTQHTEIDKLIENIRNPRSTSHASSAGSSTCWRAEPPARASARPSERALEAPDPVVRAGLSHADARPPTPSTSSASRSTSATCTGRGVQGRQMLIARRLVERGVRFVQVWHGAGQPWDSHDDIEVEHRKLAAECDQAIARPADRPEAARPARRDAGDLGRRVRPHADRRAADDGANAGKINGRDHNHYGFTMWLAGGGVKGGYVHGATDEFGFQAVENKVHVHDLHATILHLLGFDHEKLTYRYAGRDFRLTDVHGNIVHELLA